MLPSYNTCLVIIVLMFLEVKMSLPFWNDPTDEEPYRPRRPSYICATRRVSRRRSGSYQHATGSIETGHEDDDVTNDDDVISVDCETTSVQRKNSYHEATDCDCEPETIMKVDACAADINQQTLEVYANHVGLYADDSTVDRKRAPTMAISVVSLNKDLRTVCCSSDQIFSRQSTLEISTSGTIPPIQNIRPNRPKWRCWKNLIVLSLSFVFVFTAFRAIQNLQSSLNTSGRLGSLAMCFLYGSAFASGIFAPIVVNMLTPKWTMTLGIFFYLFWIAANLCPHVYTLLPTSLAVGLGHSLAWSAQLAYVEKLVETSWCHTSGTGLSEQQELYRFKGIFLSSFQTSHIWGNLVSSLMLSFSGFDRKDKYGSRESPGDDLGFGLSGAYCGVYDTCKDATNLWNSSVPSE